MPKKSRRGKGKHKRSVKLRQLAAKGTERQPKPSFVSPRLAALSKPSPVVETDPGVRYRYVLVELKRIGIIAGIMFLLLILLSFFLK